MTYSVQIVGATLDDARLQVEDYFHENLRHFPSQLPVLRAVLAMFDTIQTRGAVAYEVEIRGGGLTEETLFRVKAVSTTTRALRPTRLDLRIVEQAIVTSAIKTSEKGNE